MWMRPRTNRPSWHGQRTRPFDRLVKAAYEGIDASRTEFELLAARKTYEEAKTNPEAKVRARGVEPTRKGPGPGGQAVTRISRFKKGPAPHLGGTWPEPASTLGPTHLSTRARVEVVACPPPSPPLRYHLRTTSAPPLPILLKPYVVKLCPPSKTPIPGPSARGANTRTRIPTPSTVMRTRSTRTRCARNVGRASPRPPPLAKAPDSPLDSLSTSGRRSGP